MEFVREEHDLPRLRPILHSPCVTGSHAECAITIELTLVQQHSVILLPEFANAYSHWWFQESDTTIETDTVFLTESFHLPPDLSTHISYTSVACGALADSK